MPEDLATFQDKVEYQLKLIIDSKPLPVFDMLRYHLGWQDIKGHPRGKYFGKLIRPCLCLLSCQAAGGNTSQILPAAASLELIHNFSLIHDDIEDASYERHNQPTVWKLWGQSQAINAGDAMFTLAYLALLKLRENGVSYAKIMRSVQIMSEACLELCEGQSMDIAYEKRADVSSEDYLKMIAQKTAALIAASTSMGAYLATEDERILNSFYEFGKNLGMAYQIHDDILGIWGVEGKTGKSIKSDILLKKKTLPVIYGLENCTGKNKKNLDKLYSQSSIKEEDIIKVVEILNKSGAMNHAQKLEQHYYQHALAELDAAGIDPFRQAPLREIVHFLVSRDY